MLANYILNYPKCCLPSHNNTKHSNMPPALPSKSECELSVQESDGSDTEMLDTDLNQRGDGTEDEGEDNDDGSTGKSYGLSMGYSNIQKL
jgi:hypothetical protein